MIKLVACDGFTDTGIVGLAEIDGEWVSFTSEKGKKASISKDPNERFKMSDYKSYSDFVGKTHVFMPETEFLKNPFPVKSLDFNDIHGIVEELFGYMYPNRTKAKEKEKSKLTPVKK